MTIAEAVQIGAKRVGKRDARLFLSHVTNFSVGGLHMKPLNPISADDFDVYEGFLRRREAGEPLQYIIGRWEFMGLPLICDSRALIPRPETELLVDDALGFIKDFPSQDAPVRVLDLCTGSGCIAIAVAVLAGERAEITAADISPDALALARENAEKLALPADRIRFVQSDLLEAFTDGLSGKFDVIISNPPYVLTSEMAGLSPTVRDFEPHLALDGGADGLDFYRRLIPACMDALSDGGALFLEIGPVAVLDLMARAGFSEINLRRDYAEIERIVSGFKAKNH